MRRWKRRDLIARHFVEFNGVGVQSVKTGFKTAARLSKLAGKVTPHVLRHTAATWLMQNAVDPWEAAGYLGMTQNLEATEPLLSDGYELPYQLPRNLEEGLTLMGACEPIAEVLGEKFVKAYLALKETEYEAFFRVISSWERRHLLLHV